MRAMVETIVSSKSTSANIVQIVGAIVVIHIVRLPSKCSEKDLRKAQV